jgi:anti-sigma factor RsiW
MICDRARHLFGACWDDELTQAERDGLEGHLASCPRCRTEYDEFSRALELTASLPRVEASADLMDRVLARTRYAVTAPDVVRESGARWVPAAAVAAGAVLVVALVLVGSNLRWMTPASSLAPRPVAIVEPHFAPQPVVKSGERRPVAPRANPESLFDPDKNVDFVLGSAAVRSGRVERDPEGQQAIITF